MNDFRQIFLGIMSRTINRFRVQPGEEVSRAEIWRQVVEDALSWLLIGPLSIAIRAFTNIVIGMLAVVIVVSAFVWSVTAVCGLLLLRFFGIRYVRFRKPTLSPEEDMPAMIVPLEHDRQTA